MKFVKQENLLDPIVLPVPPFPFAQVSAPRVLSLLLFYPLSHL